MLTAKRATANSVRLVVALLVARTKSILVDEVDGGCTLAYRRQLRLEICFIVCTNSVDMVLQTPSEGEIIGADATYL